MNRNSKFLLAAVIATFGFVHSAAATNSTADKAAGYQHTCIIDAGSIKCLGDNESGQLGQGTTDDNDNNTPVTPIGLSSGVTAIAAADYANCAVKSGQVYCWGDNTAGQVATGNTTSPVTTPTLVANTANFTNSNVTQLFAGGGTFCIGKDTDATGFVHLYCWGLNSHGQVGNNSLMNQLSPVEIGNDASCVVGGVRKACWTGIGAGGTGHMCAQTVAGTNPSSRGLACWGNNVVGQIGNNTIMAAHAPTGVTLATDGVTMGTIASAGQVQGTIVDVSANKEATCAVVASSLHSKGVYCWGGNGYGEVTLNGTADKSAHKQPAYGGTAGALSISVGEASQNFCVVEGFSLKCWGYNDFGQSSGDGTYTTVKPIHVIDNQLCIMGDCVAHPGAGVAATGAFSTIFNASGNASAVGMGWDIRGSLGQTSGTTYPYPATVLMY